eukprot:CAMPEP_0171138922 /NCGR_PEP_ID=MMETSP0766_2-20121228/135921_1 /TAXON_ID=439317 /ORGANISM="Gambierdiscus australes, Strain CAWD 149" /LENGTH=118 /DNA_ID=CAMNT_0011602565 /DNA_START=97 /DNA_END=450 /DNA_ORIENTATION=+
MAASSVFSSSPASGPSASSSASSASGIPAGPAAAVAPPSWPVLGVARLTRTSPSTTSSGNSLSCRDWRRAAARRLAAEVSRTWRPSSAPASLPGVPREAAARALTARCARSPHPAALA